MKKSSDDSDSDWDSIAEPVVKFEADKGVTDGSKKTRNNQSPIDGPVNKPSKAKKYQLDDTDSHNRISDDSSVSLQPAAKPEKTTPKSALPALTSANDAYSNQKKSKSIFSSKMTKVDIPKTEDFPPAEGPPSVEPLSLGIKSSTRSSDVSKDGGGLGPIPAKDAKADAKNKHQRELKENILNLSFRNEKDKNKEKRVQKVEEERWMYTFDHGNYDEFRVSVDEPESCMNPLANRYDHALRRCWLEIFSSLRLVTDCVILFVIHLLRFVVRDVAQPLVVGIFVIVCDYLLKPALAVSFSSLFQPILVFVWNLLTSFVHAFRPVLDIVERLAHILAHLCRSLRLVEVNYHVPQPTIQRTEHL